MIFVSENTFNVGTIVSYSYRALVRLFAGVPPHMYDQHILGFERLFVPGAVFPTTNEALLVNVDMIVINMFH